MELSSQLLSQRTDLAQMARLTRLLARIRDDLNHRRVCMLQEGSTIIPLCVVPQLPAAHTAAARRHVLDITTTATTTSTATASTVPTTPTAATTAAAATAIITTTTTPIIQPHAAAVLNGEFHKRVYSQWDLTTLRVSRVSFWCP